MADVLIAETGRELGSRPAGRMRRAGKVPAIVYGMGMEPQAIALPWPELRRVLAEGGLTAPVRINIGGTEHLTIIRELQRHPVRREVLHIDFLAVDPNLTVEVDVPFVLVDPSEKGKIELVEYSIVISAKPDAIPNEIEVLADLADAAGEIRLHQIPLPAGVTTEVDGDLLIGSAPPDGTPAGGAGLTEESDADGESGGSEGDSEGDSESGD